jgi:Fe2+ or Zn2+ uptake regulation protein
MDMNFESFQIDLSQKGLRMVFKDWQAFAFLLVEEAHNPMGSKQVHASLLLHGHDISRASVINFCNRLVDAGLFTDHSVTGKGGHKSQYSAILAPELVMERIRLLVNDKVKEYTGGVLNG